MSDKISDRDLLYDPMFMRKPPEGWEDSEKGGIFGKAITKKIIFVVFLVIAISSSLLLSFNALGKEKYSYEETESGVMLSEFNGGENDRVLDVELKVGEDNRPVTSVREYAVCCNEYLDFIFIGKDVKELQYNCFYYCTNLMAVIVDPENENFRSVDGVLYNRDMTEIIIHPIRNNEYRAALSSGISAPMTQSECDRFRSDFESKFGADDENRTESAVKLIESGGGTYSIAKTVTRIAPFCFNYCDKLTEITIPDGVTEIGQMGFFKCTSLESVVLPDGLEKIGSDGLSYCEKLDYIYVPASVKEIGHHAFYGCLGCDKICLGAGSEKDVKTGEGWLPKKSERSMKNVEAVYGQERRAG